jgi:hypothetical protein
MSQEKQILSALKRGKKVTPISALNQFGCFRLAARIYDLRSQGHPIEMQTAPEGFAIYRYGVSK